MLLNTKSMSSRDATSPVPVHQFSLNKTKKVKIESKLAEIYITLKKYVYKISFFNSNCYVLAYAGQSFWGFNRLSTF